MTDVMASGFQIDTSLTFTKEGLYITAIVPTTDRNEIYVEAQPKNLTIQWRPWQKPMLEKKVLLPLPIDPAKVEVLSFNNGVLDIICR